jgi:uncharacterized OB-fold protein
MREYLTSNVALKSVSGEWGVWHRYTHGVAGERFFREMADKRQLLGSVCPKCGRTWLPANLYCEECFVEMTQFKPVGDTGTVASFTVLHGSLDEEKLAEPIVAALVTFEGVTGGLLAPLQGVAPDQVRVGLRVRAAFNTRKPTHTIADLSWTPA